MLFAGGNALGTQHFSNQCFNDSIHSVHLSNELNWNSDQINVKGSSAPCLRLKSNEQLTLRFDCLNSEYKAYSYTLVHCNPDWTPSDLFTNDYLIGYEEDNIASYSYSQNTIQPYIHYNVSFPNDNMKLSKSGNYVIVVYEVGDRDKVILTQKFYVYENKTSISVAPTHSIIKSDAQHQINFEVNQSLIGSTDPRNEFRVTVVQNNNFENQLFYQPTFIGNNLLTYTGLRLNFEAGNEFRQFDTRNINLNTAGLGVYKSIYEAPFYHSILTPVQSRQPLTYSQYTDHNGKRFVMAQKNKSAYTETDYSWVYFYLDYPEPDSTCSFYIWGELTNWEKSKKAKLQYNQKSKQYTGKLFLKQGVYDYAILSESPSKKGLFWKTAEGNFYQTDNEYLILVYHKHFNSNHFALVGFKNFNYR